MLIVYVPGTHSTWSKGAPLVSPSCDSAIRESSLLVVSPVMMTTSELPLDQPPRPTISSMTAARFGVRWAAPAAPFEVHGGGVHETEALVLFLFDMLLSFDVNAPALFVS
jgi:hypothetical protein